MPVHFGMNALAKFGDITNKSMNEVVASLNDLGKLKISEVLAFIYVGFVDGAEKAKEECKVSSIQEVGYMIDDDKELIERAFGVYGEQSPPKEKETSKKK